MSNYFEKCENCIALSGTMISHDDARPYFAHLLKNALVGCCSSDAIITPKGMPEVGVLVEKMDTDVL